MSAMRKPYRVEAAAPSAEALPKRYVVRPGPGSWFYINRRKPLVDRDDFAILARIQAAEMTFVVLDISNAPARGGRRFPFGDGGPSWHGDILILDVATFTVDKDSGKAIGGHKSAKFGEQLHIGGQYRDNFEYTDCAEEDHFDVSVASPEASSLRIRLKERLIKPGQSPDENQPSELVVTCYEPAGFMPLELCEQADE